jgi:hypothetical protein
VSRRSFILAGALSALFAGLIAVMRAAPTTDDGGLRRFMADVAACIAAEPCALGFALDHRGNLDTLNDFARHHPWVRRARFARGMDSDSGYLTWNWSGAQLPQIAEDSQGRLWVQRGVVRRAIIPTTIRLGDLWLAMPPPDSVQLYGASVQPRRVYLLLDYFGGLLRAEAALYCPVRPEAYWHTAVKLLIGRRAVGLQLPEGWQPGWDAC